LGAIIYTPGEAIFTGEVLNGDANIGQVYSSPDPVNANLFTGMGTDPFVAVSSGRTVTAIIPEPGSMGLMLLGSIGLFAGRRR
jgi:hypothetical protein